jgi:hypothetical protein
MKKNIASLLFTVMVMTSFSQVKQDTSKHLSFKGVSIDGTLDEFILKMKNSGFTQISTEDGIAILQGDFASCKSCLVEVSTLKKKDLVRRIAVHFPNSDTWTILSTNYFNLKEMLTEKYGNFSDSSETFQSSYQPESDFLKMSYVASDKCKYHTTYKTEKGSIHLSIEHDQLLRCFVNLVYSDKINSETVKKQALDDL